MRAGRKVAGLIVVLAVLGGAWAILRLAHTRKKQRPAVSITLEGAIIRQDEDPKKELPIAEVEISAANDITASDSKSDSSGFFRLTLRPGIISGQAVKLLFRHPEYKPLDLDEIVGGQIYVIRMVPIPQEKRAPPNRPEVMVASVDVRYSIKAKAVVNVGSVVKTFQVVNTGNVPCSGQEPCSPDGKWKAVRSSASLDAGQGQELRNARVSCIAGPCPFTKTELSGYSQDGRTIKGSAVDWSDTTTFLLEAEVVRAMVNDIVRQSYPVIFGEALNFTLPPGAEGVSIQADLDGSPIVFPLGPDLRLSWADCNARANNDQSKVYRCELKPGYRFR